MKILLSIVAALLLSIFFNSAYAQLPPFSCSMGNSYIPISGAAGPSGDDVTLTFPLPFTFIYIGTSYTQVSICTNGWIAMGSTGSISNVNNACTTNPADLRKLFPFWDGLSPQTSGNIQYTTIGSAPNRIFVVQYTNVAILVGGNVTFQIKLYENGYVIEYLYGPGTPGPSATATVGLIDAIGGAHHFISVTPGATCGATTTSDSVCNNNVHYIYPNLASGVKYTFGTPIGIEPISNEIPDSYRLSQNFPNPFNPVTVIQFELPLSVDVRLVLYDVLGNEMATLVNEKLKAGTYGFKLNASDYPSGVYLYKLTAGEFTETKKMVLLK